jgi:hypothetical protein
LKVLKYLGGKLVEIAVAIVILLLGAWLVWWLLTQKLGIEL